MLSPELYNRKSGMCIVAAITSTIRGGPFEVLLTKGNLPPKSGAGNVDSVILSDAVRQVDYRERSAAKVAACPAPVLDQVVQRLLAIVDPQAA